MQRSHQDNNSNSDSESNKSVSSARSHDSNKCSVTSSNNRNPVVIESPVRVKDMIQLYNSAAERNLEEAKALRARRNPPAQGPSNESKGPIVSRAGSPRASPRVERTAYMRLVSSYPGQQTRIGDEPCIEGERTTVNNSMGTGNDPNVEVFSTDSMDISSIEDHTYQSRTTICKTNKGVRIKIDILFDQIPQIFNPAEVIGTSIDTHLPRSRILREFQQQAHMRGALNSEQQRQQPQLNADEVEVYEPQI